MVSVAIILAVCVKTDATWIASRAVVYEVRPGEVGIQSVMTAESLAV